MSVSILLPVVLNSKDKSEIFFVDFSSMSVYNSSGELASFDKSQVIISEIQAEQEASMPKIPHDEILEVLRTEKNLSKDNGKYIFKGN